MSDYMEANKMNSLNASLTPSSSVGLSMLWRHKLVIISATLLGLMLGVIYYCQQPTVYESTAQVLMVRERSNVNIAPTFHIDFDEVSQLRLIVSPLIVKRALDEGLLPGLNKVGRGDPTGALVRSLSATANGNSLTVSFRGPDPDVCRRVIEAVVTSFEGYLNDTLRRNSESTLRYVASKAEKVHKKLEEDRIHYEELQESLPPVWQGENGNTVQQNRMSSIESQRFELKLRQTELESRLRAFQQGEEHVLSRGSLTAEPANPTNPLEVGLENEMLTLRMKEQILLEKFGEDYPDVRSLRREIDLKHKLYQRLVVRGNAPKNENAQVEVYLSTLLEEIKGLELSDRALVEMFEKERLEAERLTGLHNEMKQLKEEIARNAKFHETIVNELQRINLGKELGDYRTRTISPATLGVKVGPYARKILSTAAIFGILGGIGLAYLREITNTRFDTPDEICVQLGLPVVGQVPLLTPDPRGSLSESFDNKSLDPTLLDFENSQSSHAEAFRDVRRALLFGVHGGVHQVIQVTSPRVGEGKTTIAANLAVSMAQAGKSTLLVDANLRRPQIHTLFGLSTKVGLATLLANGLPLCDVTRKSGVGGLTIVPSGPIPLNSAELLTSPRFKALIEATRDEYEIVIIDTPALLEVSDPCVVADSADGVLLTIRIAQRNRSDAKNAIETMGRLAAKVTGVVVNDMDGRWRSAPSKLFSPKNRVAGIRQDRGYSYSDQHETSPVELPSVLSKDAPGLAARQAEPAPVSAAPPPHHFGRLEQSIQDLTQELHQLMAEARIGHVTSGTNRPDQEA